jgi:uncharacterized protein YacL
MPPQLTLRLARAGFVLFCCVLGVSLALGFQAPAWWGAVGGAAFGAVVAGIDVLLRRFTIGVFSSATFGLMIGVLCAWLITRIDFLAATPLAATRYSEQAQRVYELAVYCTLGFLGIQLALRSHREEFALIIPYVRFRQEGLEEQKLLVDSNVLIDGRIPGLSETGFLSGTLIVPRFVVDELHVLADSQDAGKRERGKRGLECLEAMRRSPALEVKVHEDYLTQEMTVDAKLVQLARLLGAKLLSNDANLGRVAALQSVPVLNLHALAKAMRPVILPGDDVELMLVKEGKDPHQAVGYLSDGTMIVVNHATNRLGQMVTVHVSSSLQTSAGRLIFAELKTPAPAVRK